MKRCPECDSIFPDADRFCELDGSALLPADPDIEAAVTDQTEQKVSPIARGAGRQPEMSWKIMAIVAVCGVAIGMVVFLVYVGMTRKPATQSSNTPSSNSSVVHQQGPLLPSLPPPVASSSPSLEPSPPSGVTPSPSTQTAAAQVELSSRPISTGGKTKSGPVIIRLNDGANIEADEAWQTGEGIWYRKGSIVALLNPKQVKAIEKVASATPPPSPSQSPTP